MAASGKLDLAPGDGRKQSGRQVGNRANAARATERAACPVRRLRSTALLRARNGPVGFVNSIFPADINQDASCAVAETRNCPPRRRRRRRRDDEGEGPPRRRAVGARVVGITSGGVGGLLMDSPDNSSGGGGNILWLIELFVAAAAASFSFAEFAPVARASGRGALTAQISRRSCRRTQRRRDINPLIWCGGRPKDSGELQVARAGPKCTSLSSRRSFALAAAAPSSRPPRTSRARRPSEALPLRRSLCRRPPPSQAGGGAPRLPVRAARIARREEAAPAPAERDATRSDQVGLIILLLCRRRADRRAALLSKAAKGRRGRPVLSGRPKREPPGAQVSAASCRWAAAAAAAKEAASQRAAPRQTRAAQYSSGGGSAAAALRPTRAAALRSLAFARRRWRRLRCELCACAARTGHSDIASSRNVRCATRSSKSGRIAALDNNSNAQRLRAHTQLDAKGTHTQPEEGDAETEGNNATFCVGQKRSRRRGRSAGQVSDAREREREIEKRIRRVRRDKFAARPTAVFAAEILFCFRSCLPVAQLPKSTATFAAEKTRNGFGQLAQLKSEARETQPKGGRPNSRRPQPAEILMNIQVEKEAEDALQMDVRL